MSASSPAIAAIDDPHAWLVRGFIDGGCGDGTHRSCSVTPAGVLCANSVLENNRGADGLTLTFPGFSSDDGLTDDDYVYTVKVVRSQAATVVAARCPETLFQREYPCRPDTAAAILADVRSHNATFLAWRAKGRTVSYGERMGIPDARGSACSAPFSNWLERHLKAGRSLAEGPAEGWWNAAMDKRAIGKMIAVGKGREGVEFNALPARDKPENQEYIASLKNAGTAMMVVAGLCFVFSGLNVLYGAVVIFKWGFGQLHSMAWPIGMLLLSFGMAIGQAWAGWQLRQLRSRNLVQIVAAIGMVPCVGPCCAIGLPVGAYVFYLMRDDRADDIFPD